MLCSGGNPIKNILSPKNTIIIPILMHCYDPNCSYSVAFVIYEVPQHLN